MLRALRERAPGLPIVVCTSAPAFLFEGAIAAPLGLRPVAGDVGLVQKDALAIDEQKTIAAWRAFVSGWEARVASEAEWLRQSGARLVLGDIPPLAFAAAAAAGLPSVALGNFSWDWVYRHLAQHAAGLGAAADWAAEAYRKADRLLRLPFAGDLRVFRSIEDLPLVARQPRAGREAARRLLGLEGAVVLLSFGGAGLPGLDLEAFGRLRRYLFVVTGATGAGPLPSNVRRLEGTDLAACGLEYPDLVAAADAVVTKPGYGIVTDCIAARTRLVYTDRGDFPEYPILVEGMGKHLPAAFASNQEVREGRLETALAAVLERAFPEPPRMDGAEVAAEALLRRL